MDVNTSIFQSGNVDKKKNDELESLVSTFKKNLDNHVKNSKLLLKLN